MNKTLILNDLSYNAISIYDEALGSYVVVNKALDITETLKLKVKNNLLTIGNEGSSIRVYKSADFTILNLEEKLDNSYDLDTIDDNVISASEFVDILAGNNLFNGNYVVSNVQDYITAIEAIISDCPNKEIFFRGHYNYRFKLIPSLYRKEGYYNNENFMYNDFKNQFYNELGDKKYIEILTTMQHFSMPTRLLDTTFNPLVALYMSCDKPTNYKQRSYMGEVVIMAENKKDVKYSDSNVVRMLSSLAVLETHFKQELYNKIRESLEKKDFDILRASIAYKRFVAEVSSELPHFDESFFNPEVLLAPKHVKVGMINERIIAQSGSFILFGLCDYENGTYEKLKTVVSKRIFVVNRKGILKQLEMLNITPARIYPDKDHMSTTITKSYDV